MSLSKLSIGLFGAKGLYDALSASSSAIDKKKQLYASAKDNFFQSQLSQINSNMLATQASFVYEAGERSMIRYAQEKKQAKELSKSHFASSGFDIHEGTISEKLASQDINTEIDINNLDINNYQNAQNIMTNSINQGVESTLLRTKSNNLRKAGDNISSNSAFLGSAIGSIANFLLLNETRKSYKK